MKSIPFHSSVRIELKQVGKIQATVGGRKEVLGKHVVAEIIKNRLGPPERKCEYDFYFKSGIDNYGSWLKIMKEYKIVKVGGAYYTFVSKSGEEYKFQSKEFEQLLIDNSTLKDEIYELVCEKMIMKYDDNEFGIDDIDVEEVDVVEED